MFGKDNGGDINLYLVHDAGTGQIAFGCGGDAACFGGGNGGLGCEVDVLTAVSGTGFDFDEVVAAVCRPGDQVDIGGSSSCARIAPSPFENLPSADDQVVGYEVFSGDSGVEVRGVCQSRGAD